MKEWVKGHKSILIIGMVVVFFVIPSLINIGIGVAGYFDFGVGSNGDWVNFWGSYLSSFIGVIGPIIFTIYYTQTQVKMQIKASRQAQVQAYLDQERLVALNEYQLELLTASDTISIIAKKFTQDNLESSYKDIDQAILALQDKCKRYTLLTGKERAANVNEVQNDIQKFYAEETVKLKGKIMREIRCSRGRISPTSVEELRGAGLDFANLLLAKEKKVNDIFKQFYSA